MSEPNELDRLIGIVARATVEDGQSVDDRFKEICSDIDSTSPEKASAAAMAWGLIIKPRIHRHKKSPEAPFPNMADNKVEFNELYGSAYECFCGTASLVASRIAQGFSGLDLLVNAALIAGHIESLASEFNKKRAEGIERSQKRLAGLRVRNKEVNRIFEVFSEPKTRGGKRPTLEREVYPDVAEQINRNGWKDGSGKKVMPKKPLKPGTIKGALKKPIGDNE